MLLWRLYVAVALATLVCAAPAMLRGLRHTWTRGCPCCGERVEDWRRVAACAIIAALFLTRSVLWFVWLPAEFVIALRGGLRSR